jgi:hypothetical protein
LAFSVEFARQLGSPNSFGGLEARTSNALSTRSTPMAAHPSSNPLQATVAALTAHRMNDAAAGLAGGAGGEALQLFSDAHRVRPQAVRTSDDCALPLHARSLRTSPESASNLRLGGGAKWIRTAGTDFGTH